MSTDAIFSALGGGGLTAVILALIQWGRGRGQDQGNVARNWESGVSTLLRSAEGQVRRLDDDLRAMRETAAETRRELDECQARCRDLRLILTDSLRDLESRGADTTTYRDRLKVVD